MKLNQLIPLLASFSCTFSCLSMNTKNEISYWVIDHKTASETEKTFERTTVKQIRKFNKILKNPDYNTTQPKIKLDPEIYTKIQNKFLPTPKQLIKSFRKIEFT